MLITPTDLNKLSFLPMATTATVTERVFTASHTVNGDTHDHIVLVHIDKMQSDVDGDGTIDTLDGKFCLSIIDSDGKPILVNDSQINIAQVHSINTDAVSSAADVASWVADISNELIPIVINKKAALESWGGV